MEKKVKKVKTIIWWCLFIPFLIGVFMLTGSEETTTYSTSEYWVAKDYHHVYWKHNGQIANYIEDNESVKIDGDEIIVTEVTNETTFVIGGILTGFFGMTLIGYIFVLIGDSEWWERFKDTFRS